MARFGNAEYCLVLKGPDEAGAPVGLNYATDLKARVAPQTELAF